MLNFAYPASVSSDSQQISDHSICTLKTSTVDSPIKRGDRLSADGDVEQFCCSLASWRNGYGFSQGSRWIGVDRFHHLGAADSPAVSLTPFVFTVEPLLKGLSSTQLYHARVDLSLKHTPPVSAISCSWSCLLSCLEITRPKQFLEAN